MTTSERINKIAERREMLDAQQRAMESGKAMTIANLEKGIKSLAPRIKKNGLMLCMVYDQTSLRAESYSLPKYAATQIKKGNVDFCAGI